MKKIILLIVGLSFGITGTMYMSLDLDSDANLELLGKQDFDDGAIMIGYNHPVFNNENGMSVSIGMNYSISPHVVNDPVKDLELSTYSLYMMPSYQFTESLSGWLSIGYGWLDDDNYLETYFFGLPTDLKGGIGYGLGISFQVSETWNVGFGLWDDNYEVEVSSGGYTIDLDCEISRTGLFVGYSF